MFLFFLIRGNIFRGYNYPLYYYPLCLFLDILITVPPLLLLLATIINVISRYLIYV